MGKCEGSDDAERQRNRSALIRCLEHHRIAPVIDIVACYHTVAVHFDPRDGDRVLCWLRTHDPRGCKTLPETRRTIEIRVDYHDAESELEQVAQQLKMPVDEVMLRHSSPTYEVAAIGFSPGFPYLSGLDPALALPRKPSPTRVPAGAVAVAGQQAGIYPFASPGGWHVLGKTPQTLFAPEDSSPSLLHPGDRVRFTPSSARAPTEPSGSPEVARTLSQDHDIRIHEPGMHTTIQDTGRPGHRAIGVSAGGAMDPVAAHVANCLVGNPSHAAALECTGYGPVLAFQTSCAVAWIGWKRGSGRPHTVHAGETLDLRQDLTFSHGVIAISGGIAVPALLGSRSTDVRARFGGFHGRALCAGDTLSLHHTHRRPPACGAWHVGWPHSRSEIAIRYLAGSQSDWFATSTHHTFRTSIYQTTSASDRTGMLLRGPELPTPTDRTLSSEPVVAGSIQVPPDGRPIVLLAECQTIGGYPQIGHVISADLPALARARPGTRIRFHEVGLDEARHAWHTLQRRMARLETGLSLLP